MGLIVIIRCPFLVLRTATGSSVDPAEIMGLEALKPLTDFCQRVLGAAHVRTRLPCGQETISEFSTRPYVTMPTPDGRGEGQRFSPIIVLGLHQFDADAVGC